MDGRARAVMWSGAATKPLLPRRGVALKRRSVHAPPFHETMNDRIMPPILPPRPLKLVLPKRQSRIMSFVFFLGALVLAGGFGWLTVPDLVRDAAILGKAEPATQARFVSGRCRSKLVIHFCDIVMERRTPQGPVRAESNAAFFDLHVGSYSVRLMQKAGDPTQVTTDIALDHYWNRVITSAGFVLLFGFGALALLKQALQPGAGAVNDRYKILSGRLLTPVAVDIRGQTQPDKANWLWTYAPSSSGPALGQDFELALPAGTWPFVLDREGRRALAVTDTAGGPVLMLDAALGLLDLKDEERAGIFAWRDGEVAAADARAAVPA